VDVVVVGSGIAGSVAAIEAFDTDPAAEVLILEKMDPVRHGGSGRCSAGFFYAPEPEQVENLKAYHRALSDPNPPPEDVLDAWADAVVALKPWIEQITSTAGLHIVAQDLAPDFPRLPGALACETIFTIETASPPAGSTSSASTRKGSRSWTPTDRTRPEGHSGIWQALNTNVNERGIPILYETPAVDLVQDPDSLEVFGVVAKHKDASVAIKARRAVILCCGGHAANREMLMEYCGYTNTYTLGTPGATGDGIRMLQKAGADLWHMRNFGHVGGIFPAVKVPGVECAYLRELLTASSWIDVGFRDQRFYNETGDYYANHFKVQSHGRWVDPPFTQVLPIHMIFDEATRLEGKLVQDWTGWNMVALGHEWSDDNSREIEKGWICRADSVAELAAAIGRDAGALETAVRTYNEHCDRGTDRDYQREPERLRRIDGPPFYALEIVPAIAATPGGGRRTGRAEVMATDGQPIARLYEAGELGSTFANLYQNGSYVTEAIAFGRIAGRHAVEWRSWE
jgi:succinate dehydrogenase/fumarate reductase flavoprotein subunit